MDVWVVVDPVHELLELVGDFETEQGVRAAVDPDDQDGSAVLDLKMSRVLVCHGFSFSPSVSPRGLGNGRDP